MILSTYKALHDIFIHHMATHMLEVGEVKHILQALLDVLDEEVEYEDDDDGGEEIIPIEAWEAMHEKFKEAALNKKVAEGDPK